MGISKPVISEIAGGYSFAWIEDEYRMADIKVTNLHEDSKRGLIGEFAVDLFINEAERWGLDTVLSGIRFNLLTTVGRNGISKRLLEIAPDVGADVWGDVVECVCSETIKLFRQGEPILEIITSDEFKPPTYFINPMIPEKQPTIIFGEPGVGKSEMALVIFVCLILPWWDNPLSLNVPDRSVKVMLLDYETDDDVVRWQLQRLQRGMGLPDFALCYRRCSQPLADDIPKIREAMQDKSIDCLIIDSLGAAVGGDLKDAGVAIKFFNALRGLKTTSIIIAQTSKDQEMRSKSIFGSAFFKYYARSVWEIRKDQAEEEDILNIAIYNRKANISSLSGPMGFRFSFNDDKVTITKQDAKKIPGLLAGMSNKARIIEELRYGAKATKELCESLELKRSTADAEIKRLRDNNVIVKIGDKWGLRANEELF